MGFAMTAVMTVMVLMVVLSVVWEGQFQKYTRSNMQRLADATAEALAARYDEQGGWTDEVLEYASSATSISSDAGIQVLNSRGAVIYDDTWAKSHTKSILDSESQSDASDDGPTSAKDKALDEKDKSDAGSKVTVEPR